jgi:hypothetical protein
VRTLVRNGARIPHEVRSIYNAHAALIQSQTAPVGLPESELKNGNRLIACCILVRPLSPYGEDYRSDNLAPRAIIAPLRLGADYSSSGHSIVHCADIIFNLTEPCHPDVPVSLVTCCRSRLNTAEKQFILGY